MKEKLENILVCLTVFFMMAGWIVIMLVTNFVAVYSMFWPVVGGALPFIAVAVAYDLMSVALVKKIKS